MSKLAEFLSQAPANFANPANRAPEISNFSKISRGSDPENEFSEAWLRRQPDWPEISADSNQREAAMQAAQTALQLRQGIAPEHYTATTECRHCGPVLVFPGLPAKVNGCPWCLPRASGAAVPRVA